MKTLSAVELSATETKLRGIAELWSVEDISNIVFDDPRFFVWSGSSEISSHHYGKGGLAKHTCEVYVTARNVLLQYDQNTQPTDFAQVFLAALYHDVGKMWDYRPSTEDMNNWEKTSHNREIHHISRSAIEWSRAVDKYPKYRPIEESVLHAILAHHGRREWGSPVAPKSRLAWLLHLSDCISARLDDFGTRDTLDAKK